jgi:hypothetical protein
MTDWTIKRGGERTVSEKDQWQMVAIAFLFVLIVFLFGWRIYVGPLLDLYDTITNAIKCV